MTMTNTNGYLRIKRAKDLKPRDVVLGRVGYRVFQLPKTVAESPELRTRIAEQSVVKLVDAPIWYISQSARLVVVTEW